MTPVTMFARVSGQETACAETALCSEHLTGGNRVKFANPWGLTGRNAPTGGWLDLTDNDALECNDCGRSTTSPQGGPK